MHQQLAQIAPGFVWSPDAGKTLFFQQLQ